MIEVKVEYNKQLNRYEFRCPKCNDIVDGRSKSFGGQYMLGDKLLYKYFVCESNHHFLEKSEHAIKNGYEVFKLYLETPLEKLVKKMGLPKSLRADNTLS